MSPLRLALVVLSAASVVAAHPSPSAPFTYAWISQALAPDGRVSLRARSDTYAGTANPTVTGVVVSLEPEPGDPTTVELPAGGWRLRRGTFRFVDGTSSGSRRRAFLRETKRGVHFTLLLRRPMQAMLSRGVTRIALGVSAGDLRWCAEVREGAVRETPRHVTARATVPMSFCPCTPLSEGSFKAIEQRVFGRHACLAPWCHGSAPGAAGLVLTGPAAYESLVEVASMADPGVSRVTPGDPDASMLWRKIAARTLDLPGVPGSEMPLGDPPVGANELEAIRQWILAGAPKSETVLAADVLLDCASP